MVKLQKEDRPLERVQSREYSRPNEFISLLLPVSGGSDEQGMTFCLLERGEGPSVDHELDKSLKRRKLYIFAIFITGIPGA